MQATKKDMIETHLKGRGISDERVLSAMEQIERENFVPEDMKNLAYADSPLPIGKRQTISQPYIVAYMAQELELSGNEKILEIGSGCGYNAAILSCLAKEVHSIEIIPWLYDTAQENIAKCGIENIHLYFKDGYEGLEEEAPFDAIILTAAPAVLPEPLKKQLKIGGKIIAPVGTAIQKLILIEKIEEGNFSEKELLAVSFVPMTGVAKK